MPDTSGNKPLVSVITPCFDRLNFLPETYASLKAQSYPFWEWIVVDDGSTDGTDAFFEKHPDKRIRFLKRERKPKGANACRNIGMDNANGKYFIFLDSDDQLAPSCLEQRIGLMENQGNIPFAVFPGFLFYEKQGDSNILINIIKIKDPINRFLQSDAPFVNLNCIWRRGIAKSLKWDEKLLGYQDMDFHLQALLEFKAFFSTAKPDCYWRIHEKGMGGKNMYNTKEKVDSLAYFYQKIYQNLQKTALDKTRKEILQNLFFKVKLRYLDLADKKAAVAFWDKLLEEKRISPSFYTKGKRLAFLYTIPILRKLANSSIVENFRASKKGNWQKNEGSFMKEEYKNKS